MRRESRQAGVGFCLRNAADDLIGQGLYHSLKVFLC